MTIRVGLTLRMRIDDLNAVHFRRGTLGHFSIPSWMIFTPALRSAPVIGSRGRARPIRFRASLLHAELDVLHKLHPRIQVQQGVNQR
jgi:hypothetical protein